MTLLEMMICCERVFRQTDGVDAFAHRDSKLRALHSGTVNEDVCMLVGVIDGSCV